jgi:hypothetical protein
MSDGAQVRLFVHVEEPSMKEAMEALLPRLLKGKPVDWRIIDHGSKGGLLRNLPNRLKGYGQWGDPAIRVLVLVDRDDDDCSVLKAALEHAAGEAGLPTKTVPDQSGAFRVVNRIVVEELEAWFLGDVPALVAAYPGVSSHLALKAPFRDPDAVAGGTWEALYRVLQRAGHYAGTQRLPKIEVARRVATEMVAGRNRSRSFQMFLDGLDALTAQVGPQGCASG